MDKRTMYYIAGWLVKGLKNAHVVQDLAPARDKVVMLLTMDDKLHDELAPEYLQDAVKALEDRDYLAQRGENHVLQYATTEVFEFAVAVHAQLACLYTAVNVASMPQLPLLARIQLLRSPKLRKIFRTCVAAALEDDEWMPVGEGEENASTCVQSSTNEKVVDWLFNCAIVKLDKLFGYHFARDMSNKHASARSQGALRDELRAAAKA